MEIVSIVLFCLAGLAFWVTFVEPYRLEINTRAASLKKKLSKKLRILHLSDIHFSAKNKHLDKFFDRLATQEYDFIFVTGDIFDCAEGIPFCVRNFKKLKARHGFFAVFGNHDYYDYRFIDIATMGFRGRRHPKTLQPMDLLEKALSEAGARFLRNEAAEVRIGETLFVIHGLDDPTTGRADIEKAMHQYESAHVHILLSHTIDAFFYIGENEIDLSFSGHSHGGQIRFPVIGPVLTHTDYGPPYAEGLKELKGAVCSISRGVSASRYFDLRLLCRPEAIILEVSGQ
jgi:uncharacterized protein